MSLSLFETLAPSYFATLSINSSRKHHITLSHYHNFVPGTFSKMIRDEKCSQTWMSWKKTLALSQYEIVQRLSIHFTLRFTSYESI